MKQQEIEMILARQLASYLAVPIFLVDLEGTLLFYNEPAETILGRRFEETGRLPIGEWATIFEPTDDSGAPIQPQDLPLAFALDRDIPAHRRIHIRGLDDVDREIEISSFPIIGQAQRRLGGIAIFWEVS